MSKSLIWTLCKYLLAFALLGYVVYANWAPPGGQGLEYVWQRHVVQGEPLRTGCLLTAGVVLAAAVLLTMFRWYLLVRAVDLPLTPGRAIGLGLIGFFFSTFLPSSIGGDVIKAAALARSQSRRTVAVATVIMDRAIALWGLAWFVALLGSIFWLGGALEGTADTRSKTIVLVALIVVGLSVVVWLLLGLLPDHRAERFAGRLSRLPKVGGAAAEFWRAVWMYRRRPYAVAFCLALSWVGHVGFVFAFYFSALTLWDGRPDNPMPSVAQHFLLVPIGLVVQAVAPFPGGMGIGELGFGKLYGWFRCSEAIGILGSLVQRMLTWVLGLIGYLVYTRMSRTLPRAEPGPDGTTDTARVNGAAWRQPTPEATSAR